MFPDCLYAWLEMLPCNQHLKVQILRSLCRQIKKQITAKAAALEDKLLAANLVLVGKVLH